MTLLIQSLTITLIAPAITLIATFIHSFAGRRGTVLSLYGRPMTSTTNMLWHHTYFLRRGDHWSPLNSYFTYPLSRFNDSSPQAKSLSLRRGGTQWRSGGYRDTEASYSLYTGGRWPPLQICYDTTHTFFVGAIIGRPFNSYFTYSVVSRQLPSRGATVVAATHHFA